MTLIIILIGMAVEHFVSVSDEIRRLAWFEHYLHWLENRLAQYKLWNGAGGVICTLSLPLILLLIIDYGLKTLFSPLSLLFALAVLLYSLGPKYLNAQLDDYIDALEEGNKAEAEILASEFVTSDNPMEQEHLILESILVLANERLFGVLFWFIVLGPFGALLYRLASLLHFQQSGIHGNYADSARDLYDILNWPTARLLAIGHALSGDLVDAVEAWREVERQSLSVNEDVIKASGLGALSYQHPDPTDIELSLEDHNYWIHSLQGLLNRTLLVWLSVLGLMTLSGWLT